MKKYLPILALISASIIWGAASPIFKWSLQNIPIFPLVFVRFFLASFFLLPFLKSTAIKKKDRATVVLLGVCAVSLNVTFFFLGISLTSAINGGVMAVSAPIFTILAARIFLKERLTPNLAAGSLVGLAGVFLIVGQSLLRQGISADLWGNLFLVLSVWALVAHEILIRKLHQKYDSVVLTYSMFTIGALTFLPPALWQLIKNPQFLVNLDIRGFSGIVYGIFFSSLAAYFLWNWGLSQFPAAKAGIFLYADPPAAALVAMALLGERITTLGVLGATLIFAGIYLAEKRIHYHHLKIKSKTQNHQWKLKVSSSKLP